MLQVQLFGAGRVLDDVGEIKLSSRAWTSNGSGADYYWENFL